MLDQLKLLENLQQVDAELQHTQEALTSLPAKLQSLKENVKRVEEIIQNERQQLIEVEHYKAELEGSMKTDQDHLNKSKAKLSQVRTSKEYMATQRELESTRKSTGEREEELLKLIEAIDNSQKRIAVHEEELKTLMNHVDDEEAETQAKIADLRTELEQQQTARSEMSATIRKDILAKYQTICRRRGVAVVRAERGVCMGCNMHLPPQLFIILQRGTTIEHCPSCQRIIFFEPENEGEQQ